MKYVCELCGYVYDEAKGIPDRGIAPGTAFMQLPESFECPHCGYGKEAFDPTEQGAQSTKEGLTEQHSQR